MRLPCGAECLIRGDVTKPVLVLLHGVGSDASGWDFQLREFESHFRTAAWNLPGYGGSIPCNGFTFPFLVKFLKNSLEELKIEKAHFVGHSFGGMLLQEFVREYPDSVKSMVFYATSPAFGKADSKWQKEYLNKRLKPLENGETLEELAPKMIRSMTGENPEPGGMELALKSVKGVTKDAYIQALKCMVGFDGRDNLNRLNQPVLLVAAEKDPNAQPLMMEKMASKIPGARFVCLPKVGHLAHLENPKSFHQVLNEFYESIEK